MAPNSDKYLLSNGTEDRVSLFYDGRVKVWSRFHLWEILEHGRHNALGEFVRIGVGRALDVKGPTGTREKLHYESPRIDPALGGAEAATIAADNGTFVIFHHDGSITVGNDGRDIEETVNGAREGLAGTESGRGGSVMIFFAGSYRPRAIRRSDCQVHIPEDRRRVRGQWPDEYEIREGKVGPRKHID